MINRKYPSRTLASLRGGLIKIERMKIYVASNINDIWVVILQFDILGSEGSLTFGSPSYVNYNPMINGLLTEMKRYTSMKPTQTGFFFFSNEKRKNT